MKQKRLLTWILAVVLVVSIVSFAACNNSHTHVDANSDYKCDTCGEYLSHGHIDSDGDGKCDICGDTMQISHSEHVDANNDGKCDLCGMTIDPTHTVHKDEDEDGKCDVCNVDVYLVGTATVVIGEKTYTVDYTTAKLTAKNSAADAVIYVANTNTDYLSIDYTYSSYGVYVNAVSALDTSTKGAYIALFVNDETLKSTYAGTPDDKIVNGTTYYYSGEGFSSIKLVDGLSILLAVEVY